MRKERTPPDIAKFLLRKNTLVYCVYQLKGVLCTAMQCLYIHLTVAYFFERFQFPLQKDSTQLFEPERNLQINNIVNIS